MPDDTAKTIPQDVSRVNVHQESEVEYWCRRFGVTPSQLRAAVAKVENLVRRVETELKGR